MGSHFRNAFAHIFLFIRNVDGKVAKVSLLFVNEGHGAHLNKFHEESSVQNERVCTTYAPSQ